MVLIVDHRVEALVGGVLPLVWREVMACLLHVEGAHRRHYLPLEHTVDDRAKHRAARITCAYTVHRLVLHLITNTQEHVSKHFT